MLFIAWSFVGVVLDDDVMTSVVEGSIVVRVMVSCEGSTDVCVGNCCIDVGFLLPTAEDFRILLDVVIDPMVEVGILLIVYTCIGGCILQGGKYCGY